MRKSFSLTLVALAVTAAAFAQTAPAVKPAAAPAQSSKSATAKSTTAKPDTVVNDEAVVEEIVARVNNAIITRGDLRREREKMVQDFKQQNISNLDATVATEEKNLLRTLIDQQLLVQKADELNINVDADIIKRVDQMRRDMGASTMEELEKAAADQGINFEDFKLGMKNDLLTQHVIGQEVGSHIRITNEDVQKYFDAHKAEYDQPEQVDLSEILVPVGTDADALAQAQAQAKEILAKLKAGAKFADMVKQYSKGPSAKQDGDLGYFKRGMLAKELEDATFALPTGGITAPLQTRQGLVILQVTEHVMPGVPSAGKLDEEIKNTIYSERIQSAMRDYLTKLREDAYINIHEGYVDTGASANQTNPVVTNTEVKSSKGKANTVKTIKDTKKKKHFIFF